MTTQFPPLEATTQVILAKSFHNLYVGQPNWERALLSNFLRTALVEAHAFGTEDLYTNLLRLALNLEAQPSKKPNP